MALVGQHSVAPFTLPTASPVPPSQVRGNDNVMRQKFNAHDDNAGIHNQSGPIAQRPAAPDLGSVWYATDTGAENVAIYTATGWVTLVNLASAITGSGTPGTLTKWTGGTSLGDSIISESGSAATVAGSLTATSLIGPLTGNASTATALATSRNFSITGDVTAPAQGFDGTANVVLTATLANTGVVAGSYGSATQVGTFTVDSKGRLTAAANVAIGGLNTSVLTAGTLGVARGGTGVATITGIIKGNGTSAFSAAVAGTDYLTPTGNGSGLTNLNASNISSGTLADARLSSNVALLSGSPTFAGNVAATSTLSGIVVGSPSGNGGALNLFTNVGGAGDTYWHLVSRGASHPTAADDLYLFFRESGGSFTQWLGFDYSANLVTANKEVYASGGLTWLSANSTDLDTHGTTALRQVVPFSSQFQPLNRPTTANYWAGFSFRQNLSNTYVTQLAVGTTDANTLATRYYNNSTWSAWVTYLNNSNFNNYAPTLTGTGASGTWGISITGSSASTTGNAATATALQTTRTIWGQNFNGTANVSGAFSGATTGDFSSNVTIGGTLTMTTNDIIVQNNARLRGASDTHSILIGTSGAFNIDINSVGSARIAIDTDASTTGSAIFGVYADAADGAGTLLFSVREDGRIFGNTQDITFSNTGPVVLTLEADTDNVTETDNPRILFKQDGGAVITRLGNRNNANSFEMVMEFSDSMFLGVNNTDILQLTTAGATVTGTVTASGTRNITLNSASGDITINASAGGWTYGLEAVGSSGTNQGGFGFYGNADALSYYYIGLNYLDANAIKLYQTGNVIIPGVASVGGQVQGASGSAASPSFTFSADTNTGIFRVTENVIGFATGGVQRASISDTLFDAAVSINLSQGHGLSFTRDGSAGFLPYVGGGQGYSNVSSLGAIKIALPTGGAAKTDMVTFWVDIFDYTVGESVSLYIGGYVYQAIGADTWVNCTALVFAKGSTTRDYTVRFGDDGANHCIWIGETTTTWSYPQVVVRDVQAAYAATVADYREGWAISFAQVAFGTVNETQTGNLPMASTATTIATARTLWGNSFDGSADIDNNLQFPSNGSAISAATRAIGPDNSSAGLTLNVPTGGAVLDKVNGVEVFRTSAAQVMATMTGADGFQLYRTTNSVNSNIRFRTTGTSVYAGHGAASTFAVGGTADLTTSPWFTATATSASLIGSLAVSGAITGVTDLTLSGSLNLTGSSLVLNSSNASAYSVIGGTSSSAVKLYLRGTMGTSVDGYGLYVNTIGTASNTSTIRGGQFLITGAASTVHANAYGVRILNILAGSGGSITTTHGLYIDTQSGGGTNYSIYTGGGTARFGGPVVGTSTADFTTSVTAPLWNATTADTRDKIRVWNSNLYTIGMKNGYTFGGLGGNGTGTPNYAMSFQFSATDERGWWWGDSGHSDAQGAAALTTTGRMTLAHSLRLGYGEADTTLPGVTYRLDVSGDAYISGAVGIGTNSLQGKLTVRCNASQIYGVFDAPTSGFAYHGYQFNSAYYGYIGQGNALVTGGSSTALAVRSESELLFGAGGSSERMRISATGLVGIGTTSPGTLLHVQGAITTAAGSAGVANAGGTLWLTTGTNDPTLRGAAIQAVSVGTSNAHRLDFYTNAGSAVPTLKMRLDESGNVIVGDTATYDGAKFYVSGGKIVAGNSSVAGGVALQTYYSSGALNVWGGMYSSGASLMGFGVASSTSVANTFISTTGITIGRSAYTLDAGVHRWYTGGSQTVAIGNTATVFEKMSLDNSGILALSGTLRLNGATSGTVGDINIRRSATEGYIYIGDGGNRYIGATGGTFVFGSTITTVRSVSDNLVSLGDATYRWANVYSTLGNFSSTVTATLFSGSGASLTNLVASNLASGTVPTARLGSGTANSTTYLRGDQTWATISGTGDVVGPAGATDNAIVRFDTATGKLVQNSTVTISDAGTMTFPTPTAAAPSLILPMISGNDVPTGATDGSFVRDSDGVQVLYTDIGYYSMIPRVNHVASQTTFTSTTVANVTGLSFPVDNDGGARDRYYRFRAVIWASMPATTTGIKVAVTWPTGGACSWIVYGPNGTLGVDCFYEGAGNGTSGNAVTFTGNPGANIRYCYVVEGVYQVGIGSGAQSGNLQIQLGTEVNASAVTLYKGSYIEFARIRVE